MPFLAVQAAHRCGLPLSVRMHRRRSQRHSTCCSGWSALCQEMLERAKEHGVAPLEWVEASDGHEVGLRRWTQQLSVPVHTIVLQNTVAHSQPGRCTAMSTPSLGTCGTRLLWPWPHVQELVAMGTSAEAASNAETAVTQLVQLFTVRAQVLCQQAGTGAHSRISRVPQGPA